MSDLLDHGATTDPIVNDCWNQIGVTGDLSCPELQKHIHCHNCPVYSSAAAILLKRELPDGYLNEWTAHYAQQKQAEESKSQSIVIFRVGAEWMGFPTTIFQEVTESKPIHSLPHQRSNTILGLANVRGELLICASLEKLLGLEKDDTTITPETVYRRLLVTHRKDHRLVFPVDEVHGVHRFRSNEMRSAPATLTHMTATYTKAVLMWRNKAVGCLDDELIFNAVIQSFL
jgi:chemotaxis-related protein WspD